MTSKKAARISRRNVVLGVAAASGGLAIGLDVVGRKWAHAQKVVGAAGDEIGAWVVIRPNEEVVIRIARSEMGQGTLTGLAQLVAEELECDWKNVRTEMPTPGQSYARKRIWGEMGTGGSRGIRTSEQYVRQGGAAARTMLLQAAAEQWKVPVGELTVTKGVIYHARLNRQTSGQNQSQASPAPASARKAQGIRADGNPARPDSNTSR